jgi:dipeptide/tripeptide permease
MSQEKKMGLTDLFKSFPKAYWFASIFELLERYAWYGLFAVLGIYLTNELGFSSIQRGDIMSIVTAILYFLPVFTGALADKIGYKLTLAIAYVILMTGYFLMGEVTTYWAVFSVFLYVAVGAAMFKPVASAIVTKTTNKENSSFGFGLFYMMVNIGGFFGPLIVGILRNDLGWKVVFLSSSVAILLNLIILFFFEEPGREKMEESAAEAIKKSVLNIIEALKDAKLTVLLIIMVGFWLMFNQLFYTLPNFIDDWVRTEDFYQWLHGIWPAFANIFKNENGGINPEQIVNLDAFFIFIFQIAVSYFILKWKPINAMMTGIFITILGIGLSFYSDNPFYTVLGILIFALGEMTSNPKFSDYIAQISPKGKEALYMGTYFLPIAAANYLTTFISGNLYQEKADKLTLLFRYLKEKGIKIVDHTTQKWVTYTTEGIQSVDEQGNILKNLKPGIKREEILHQAAEKLHMSTSELQQVLWDTYHPNQIWWVMAGVGAATFLGLLIYNQTIGRNKKDV